VARLLPALPLVLLAAAPVLAQTEPPGFQQLREKAERNLTPQQKAEIKARVSARFALCGQAPSASSVNGLWDWHSCVNAVEEIYDRSQPPAPRTKPNQATTAPALATPAAKPGEQRVWVNGVVIPTCSHGGLCHGRLMEALRRPSGW
jgi:hypothetical protein